MCVDMGEDSHFRERGIQREFTKRGVHKKGGSQGVHKKGGSRELCEPSLATGLLWTVFLIRIQWIILYEGRMLCWLRVRWICEA